MPGLRRRLPPLTGLVTFEAAARLSSFTRAAAELGVTQAAVSRQIHLLEGFLGFPLFHRLHRGIELTEKGRTLAAAASRSLNLLADTVAEISDEGPDNELVISATVAFSHFWLLPKVSLFSAAHPDIKLRIVTQDDAPETGGIDVAIRYGNGMWPEARAQLLFRDEVFPVCSPGVAASFPGVCDLAGLLGMPLIVHQHDNPVWMGWGAWLAGFGAELPKRGARLVCSSYIDSIYAALNGQGVALGWAALTADLLHQGRLVRVTDCSRVTSDAYHAVIPQRDRTKASVGPFLDWLAETVRA